MNFMHDLALIGTASTILGIFVTVYAIINNKTLKYESRQTRELMERETAATRQILERMDQRLERTDQVLERIEQGQKEARHEMAEAIKELKETIRYIADLIVSESDKTRQAIKAQS